MIDNSMKAGSYYFTTPDEIYGLMRKTLIFVVCVKTKIFTYKIVEWESDINENIVIKEHYSRIYYGLLKHSEYFQEKNVIVDPYMRIIMPTIHPAPN